MKFLLQYKGFTAEIINDEKRNILIGKILNIPEIVTFQGRSGEEIKQAFYNATDNYIQWLNSSNNPTEGEE